MPAVPSDYIKGFLRENFGIERPPFPDLPDNAYDYCPPDFRKTFPPLFRAFKRQAFPKIPWWQFLFRDNAWDCDDNGRIARWLAEGAAIYASILHRQEGGRNAIAFFEFWYYRNGNPADEHAIDLAMFGPTEIDFFEPQSERWVSIDTRAERCTWYR